ncbi:MAG TPA: hypothetical protein VF365_01600 [Candidatus Limnocylindria bacterium]
MRVTDAFDAITHVRPYKPARSVKWALEELTRHSGTQFDPELVRLLVDLVRADESLLARIVAHRAAA